ncbi:hypothetical protein DAMA08_004450 [Martiniozyma asiatica (nom. inval.)]|nr:hypothetical protein DAMA08_004450 [Martiniozyma asiatica]
MNAKVLVLSAFFVLTGANLITTTLSPAQQTSAAVIGQKSLLEQLAYDIYSNTNYDDYLSTSNDQAQTEIYDFIVKLGNYNGNDFPTSIFVDSFPFDEYTLFMAKIPWYSSLLKKNGASTLLVPSDYAVETITTSDDETFSSDSFLKTQNPINSFNSVPKTLATKSTTHSIQETSTDHLKSSATSSSGSSKESMKMVTSLSNTSTGTFHTSSSSAEAASIYFNCINSKGSYSITSVIIAVLFTALI